MASFQQQQQQQQQQQPPKRNAGGQMKDLLAQTSEAPTPKHQEKKHTDRGDAQTSGTAMEALVRATPAVGAGGGAVLPTHEQPQRKHFEGARTSEAEVGHLSAEGVFKPSIKLCPHNEGSGDLVKQVTSPSDLSNTQHPGKRVFDQAKDSVELAVDFSTNPEPAAKKRKSELTGVAAALATDSTGALEPHLKHKKIVEDAANKVDHIEGGPDAGGNKSRRHFQCAARVGIDLAHPQSDAPKRERQPVLQDRDPNLKAAQGPVAGMKSAQVNRPKTAPTSHAQAAAGCAGVSSSVLNEATIGDKAPKPAQAAARAAMGSSSMSSCLQWGN